VSGAYIFDKRMRERRKGTEKMKISSISGTIVFVSAQTLLVRTVWKSVLSKTFFKQFKT